MAFGALHMHIKTVAIHIENRRLSKELIDIKSSNIKLEMKLHSQLQLKNIYKEAVESLDMVFPAEKKYVVIQADNDQ